MLPLVIPLGLARAIVSLARAARRPAILAAISAMALTGQAGAQGAYAFTTLAGTAGFGYADGTGAAARFASPEGIVTDTAGNAYIADNGNFAIRKVTPNGVVTTVAGLYGAANFRDGAGDDARFNSLVGLAIDSAGNLYVCDSGNSVIRKMTPGGLVSTLAGTPHEPGAVDGPAASARFYVPRALAVSVTGDVYVADAANHAIRKISGGVVSTYAGTLGTSGSTDGPAATAKFNTPSGLVFDASGNLYVGDAGNHLLRKIAPNGTVTTVAGSAGVAGYTDGPGLSARLRSPRGLAIDSSGSVWFADLGNNAIRRLKSDGTVGTVSGGSRGFADGSGSAARYRAPSAVAVDGNGYIWIADTGNSSIRKLVPPGTASTVAGTAGIGATDGIRGVGSFFQPLGVALESSGTLIVVDTYNHSIRRVAMDGTTTTVAGKAGAYGSIDGSAADARFFYPHYAAADASGNVYVSDTSNYTIRKITPAGLVFTLAGQAAASGATDGTGNLARFARPEGLVVDATGNLFVADAANATIRKITPTGTVTTFAGAAGEQGSVDGPATAARFILPQAMAIDPAGNLYVFDDGAFTVRKITPSGLVTTLAGLAGVSGEVDGTGGAARFLFSDGIAVDAAGNVFVTEFDGSTVRKITPGGVVTTIGGHYGGVGYADALGTSARMNSPAGIAVDPFGNLYIGEYDTGVIRKAGLTGTASPASALTNASVRANITAGQRLIVGFATNGPKTVAVRGVGPGLSPYISGITLANDPSLELYSPAGDLVEANDNWGGSDLLRTTFASLGAFPLDAGSRDAALLRAVNGVQTVHVQTPASGLGLVELYALAPNDTSSRLTNLSARYQVGNKSDVLVAGFVVSGTAPKTVLIRGVGISLRVLFGVSDALDDPVLKVYNANQEMIAMNNDFDPHLGSTFDAVGAFQYAGIGPDAAILVSLAPGAYTAQLSGVGDTTGNGMIEVYEVGN